MISILESIPIDVLFHCTAFEDTNGNVLFKLKAKTFSMRGSHEATKADGSTAFTIQGHFKRESYRNLIDTWHDNCLTHFSDFR